MLTEEANVKFLEAKICSLQPSYRHNGHSMHVRQPVPTYTVVVVIL